MERILIIGEFPAPYRSEVFADLARRWEARIYFECQWDEKRTAEWLTRVSVNCEILDNKKSKKMFWNDIKNLEKFNAIIIYNNCFYNSIILEVFCKIKKVPFFVNCDGCNDIEEHNLLKKILKHYLMRGAKGYFAGSQSAVKYFEYYGVEKKRIHLHHFTSLHEDEINKRNLTDIEKTILKQKINMIGNFNVVTVGRHIECKGFDIVLKAAERIGVLIDFYIIGGEASEENRRYQEQHNLKNVHFIDFLNKNSLREYYNAADLFVLMTRGDTWGLVINEAMANGLPIITTDRCVAGVELVENGVNGYIIAVDDTDALVEKIKLLRDNIALRRKIADANIEKMKKNIIDNIAKNHIQVLEDFFEDNK
ncbi:glycosyltransferase family 4 protein [Eisenbergiella massiliensis]|uniref:Glycosyltransferase n=1 Tax=Eisenbergiella massiliensis TaxID=1720294 RepID=A0A3E3I0C0_9FIRM|nr:glycosyltransferase family 4 protein [Eisenbergiella massiliensis]RGE57668.1 glycosyltransferase [Eisenbergiella massiliensis]